MNTFDPNNEYLLNEAMAAYIKQSPGIFFSASSKRVSYKEFLSNKLLIIKAIREGVSYKLFEAIYNYAPFSESDWADFLDISTKSLQRYKSASDHRFKPIHSEKIIEIAEVTYTGRDVFGNMDKFNHWLHTPNYVFGYLKPFELLRDSYGKELILSELVRINHGILA